MIIKIRKMRNLFFVFLMFAVLFCSVAREAQALLFTTEMIFVGERENAAYFKMKNTSDKPKAFRIEWLQMEMRAAGGKRVIPEGVQIPNVRNAEPYMFAAPRRLILQPGQTQHIRFMVRRTGDMVAGEYRSYIAVMPEEIPEAFDGGEIEPNKQKAQLNLLTGYRIPVFFLHGQTELSVNIANARLVKNRKGRDEVAFTLARQGNRSVIGDVNFSCVTADGQSVDAGGSKVKIFTELNSREYSKRVNIPEGGCSRLVVNFVPHKEDPAYNGGIPLATTEVALMN